jgi:asparagine synthase (glutamine-hydrolysing)
MGACGLAGVQSDPCALSQTRHQLVRQPRLTPLFESDRIALFAQGEGQKLVDRGIVLGSLYPRSGASPKLDERAQRDCLSTGGRSLIPTHWGGYVAFIVDERSKSVTVLRSPLGDLPCYYWRSRGFTLVASDVASLIAAGMPRPSLDADALARHIGAEDLRRAETCLHRIRELPGGECLVIAGSELSSEICWTPWSFAHRGNEITDPDQAAEVVRTASMMAVMAQAQSFPSLVLKLSGGLDSSIVAACLARSGTRFTALNLVTEHPAGDERAYARAVAEHLKVPLEERLRRVEDVDVAQSAAARLPRPTARAFTQASAVLASEVAAKTGSAAVFDGGGGDNVFCSLQSARPVVDCLLDHSGRGSLWPTAQSVATLADVSVWAVLRRAIAISLRRSASYSWQFDTRFMSDDAAAIARRTIRHPWLDAPSDARPGKAAHVALVAAAQSVAEARDVDDALPEYSPLISQPVVEACLRVASWLWFADGQNRFAARRAFTSDLPPKVINRRSKGAPDCFVADLFEANRGKIRDMLLGGVLDQAKLIDTGAIATQLDDEAPVQGHEFLRIMHLADAEGWARNWA